MGMTALLFIVVGLGILMMGGAVLVLAALALARASKNTREIKNPKNPAEKAPSQ